MPSAPSREALLKARPDLLHFTLSLLLGFTALLAANPGSGGPWKNWTLIALAPESDTREIAALLTENHIDGILRPETQMVDIADYSGNLSSMSLASLGERIFEGDPRLDEYLLGLGKYFHAKSGAGENSLWYLPTQGTVSFSGKLSKALEARGVRIIGPSPGFFSSPPLVTLLIALLGWGLLLFERRRLALALMFLPWLLLSLRGGPALLALGASLGLLPLARGLRILPSLGSRTGLPRRVLLEGRFHVLLALCFPLYAAACLAPRLLFSFALSLLSSLALGLALRYRVEQRGDSPRRAFLAVPISSKPVLRLKSPSWSTLVALTLLVAASLSFLIYAQAPAATKMGEGELILPLPRASLSAVGVETLPGLAAYLRHLALQKGFFTGILPAKVGETEFAKLASSLPPARGVGEETLQAYGFALPQLRPLSLERLLRDQGSRVAIELAPYRGEGTQPLAPLAIILYIFPLVLVVIAAIFQRRGRGSQGT